MDSMWKAVLAGLFFGVWPLLMNRSGLTGYVSAACFSAVTFAVLSPIALWASGGTLPVANWWVVLLAGVIGALGLIAFNGMLATATPQRVGTLFVLMTVVQVAIAATYHIVVNREFAWDKSAGFMFATLAAYLLLR